MEPPKPTTAFIGTFYVGTDRLERPLTDSEKKDLSAVLRKHDLIEASLISLRFAFKLRRGHQAARDLQGRANLRLMRRGWDPMVVTLVNCLCRFVWSEHKHEARESATAREATEAFLREQSVHPSAVPSVEERIVQVETKEQEDARGKQQIETLRAAFVAAGDDINVLWLNHRLAGVADPIEMARLSGREVGEFYRAADRRKRHTARLLATQRSATFEESK